MTEGRAASLDAALETITQSHGLNTLGAAVIVNGEMVWEGYYGQQSEGIQASPDTMFNVGSITKTVTAETVLRLVEEGKIALDAPVSADWVDPDLVNDERHRLLTPRVLLSHRSGLMNWRFFTDDAKLTFLNDPATSFGYSGEGFEYLARFVEARLDASWEDIVAATALKPLNLQSVAVAVRDAFYPRIAKPFDTEGEFPGYFCHPGGYCKREGQSSAAGDMVITVRDYGRFLIAAMSADYLPDSLRRDRNTLQGIQVDNANIDCSLAPEAICPTRLGYGLGWAIAELPGDRLIGHRGSDWSTVSMAYWYEQSRDGLIVFINAPNAAGIAAMVDVLKLLDPDSPELHGYLFRRQRNQ